MKKILFISSLIILSFIISINFTLAGATTEDKSEPKTPANIVSLPNPLGAGAEKTDIPNFLGQIINYAMGIIGSLALVMFIYGGAIWMLSGGNQEQVTKGKQIVIWAALGIALIFTAYALVHFILSAIGGATTVTPASTPNPTNI